MHCGTGASWFPISSCLILTANRYHLCIWYSFVYIPNSIKNEIQKDNLCSFIIFHGYNKQIQIFKEMWCVLSYWQELNEVMIELVLSLYRHLDGFGVHYCINKNHENFIYSISKLYHWCHKCTYLNSFNDEGNTKEYQLEYQTTSNTALICTNAKLLKQIRHMVTICLPNLESEGILYNDQGLLL